jgi:hypothetical protein
VSCEARQEQVSLLIDAELEVSGQAALFGHLEECLDCRLFFDSMVRLRRAAKRDQEEIELAADEVLPRHIPLPMHVHPSGNRWRRLLKHPFRHDSGRLPGRLSGNRAKRWLQILAGGWRMPVPMAVGLAMVLLVAGALVGARLSALSGSAGLEGPGGHQPKPTVVVICSLPEVQVLGSGSHL